MTNGLFEEAFAADCIRFSSDARRYLAKTCSGMTLVLASFAF
jgi:hypothetical protein